MGGAVIQEALRAGIITPPPLAPSASSRPEPRLPQSDLQQHGAIAHDRRRRRTKCCRGVEVRQRPGAAGADQPAVAPAAEGKGGKEQNSHARAAPSWWNGEGALRSGV